MSDVQQDVDWWVASNGKWYPPAQEAPKAGWWVASDGKWYPPRKATRSWASTPSDPPTGWRATATAVLPVSGPYLPAEESASRVGPFHKPWGLALVVIVSGALMAVGGFLPWGTASVGPFSISVDGTYHGGDGWIAFGVGIALALTGAALWMLRGSIWRVLPLVVAAAGLALGIYEVVHITNVSRQLQQAAGDLTVQLNVAYGLIIVVLGATAGMVAGIATLCTWKSWSGGNG
jgi:hypothetical protein